MQPQVDEDVDRGSDDQEPLRIDAEGNPVFADWDETYTGDGGGEIAVEGEQAEWVDPAVTELESATGQDLMTMAGIEPIVSTSEAAEYFDRTSQWIYWGLKPDEETGEHVFVWDDGTPIVPDRVRGSGNRRFTMAILRGILLASYRRGNIAADELQIIIRRIRYTELGVEWREKEGWRLCDLGRNRHRWVRPELAYYDKSKRAWKLRKKPLKVRGEYGGDVNVPGD